MSQLHFHALTPSQTLQCFAILNEPYTMLLLSVMAFAFKNHNIMNFVLLRAPSLIKYKAGMEPVCTKYVLFVCRHF